MKNIVSFLRWSIIPAAFIGPGTVTTCATAGSNYGLALLWPLTFSTLACFLLQEQAARLRLATGKNLGEALVTQWGGSQLFIFVRILVVGAILFGNAAYQAGNMLGAVAGGELLLGMPRSWLVVFLGLAIYALLSSGVSRWLTGILGLLVLGMSFTFIGLAISASPGIDQVVVGSFKPSIPEGSLWVVLGLIGTTVVPYNLFLGAAVADNSESLSTMRRGLGISVVLGGLISMAIVIAGTVLPQGFSFPEVALILTERLGGWAGLCFGFGLFAAGFSSAITAPWAAALTAQSMLGSKDNWKQGSAAFKGVWLVVVLIGLFFGIQNQKPIEAILIAQALNGLVLPFIAVFLFWAMNDKALIPAEFRNPRWLNVLTALVILLTILLAISTLWRILQ